jgi:tetraacyldisaccharide 4'-kinase
MEPYLYQLATDTKRGLLAAIIKLGLWVLSLIYGLVIRVLSFIFQLQAESLNCKVISVGNLTLGGSGKTTLVEYVAGFLRQQGRRVAILSRGYKSKAFSCQLSAVSYRDRESSLAMGDEPDMLQRHLPDVPVVVNPDRIRAAREAIANFGSRVVVLDDGLQQWRIKKDLEIVAIDAARGFGNAQLLPRGILREPLAALKRADIFVLTKIDYAPDIAVLKDFLETLNPSALVVESRHRPLAFHALAQEESSLKLGALEGKTVTLFCGIGDPDSFVSLVRSLGIAIGLSFIFPDHHDYTQQDLKRMISASQAKGVQLLLTTEKDASRLRQLPVTSYQLPVLVLRIALEVTNNEAEFHQRLLGVYNP